MSPSNTSISIPAPRRASLILAGGLSTAALILSVWLLVWLTIQMKLTSTIYWIGPTPDSPVATALLFQKPDATVVGRSVNAEPRLMTRGLAAEIKTQLSKQNSALVVVSAVGFLGAEEKGGSSEVFLASQDLLAGVIPEGTPGQVDKLSDVIDAFKSTPGHELGPRLLILDMGRVGVHREIGLFGDDVVAKLKGLVKGPPERSSPDYQDWKTAWGGFAVFCSCASGQWSLASDGDGRSVFGHYVAEALGRGRHEGEINDAKQLLDWVPDKVNDWTKKHGSHKQTPIVLGDLSIQLVIPHNKNFQEEPPEPIDSPQRDERIAEFRAKTLTPAYHWERDAEARSLFALDPFSWREFRSAVLRAERFHRAGQLDAANQAAQEIDAAWRALSPLGRAARGALPGHVMTSLAADDAKTRGRALEALSALTNPPPPPPAKAEAEDEAAIEPEQKPPAKPSPTPQQPSIETRLRDWANRYGALLKSLDDPSTEDSSFAKDRAEEIKSGTLLRVLAEQAAASWRSHPWVDHFLQEGDRQRRIAEDALFDDETSLKIAEAKALARVAYDSALSCSRSLALAVRVACDLPELGAWHVRQGRGVGLLDSIAEDGQALNALLDRGYDPDSSPPDLAALKKRTEALSVSFDRLADAFRSDAEQSVLGSNWGAIDVLLASPGIDPDLRLKLVDKSNLLATNAKVLLRPRSEEPPANAPSEPSAVIVGLTKLMKNELGARSIASEGLAKVAGSPYWHVGPPPLPEPDPSYRKVALGMARLELCLLTLGGVASPEDLGRLKTAIVAEKVDRLGPIVRQIRARVVDELQSRPLETPKDWEVAERGWLGLPSAIHRGAISKFAKARVDRRRADLLVRQANRALDDLDLASADVYLEAVPSEVKGGQGFPEAIKRRESMAGVSRIERQGSGPLRLAVNEPENPLVLRFQVGGSALPEGLASFVVAGQDPSKALLIPDGQDRYWEIESVPVGGQPPPMVAMTLGRANEVNPNEVALTLLPKAFFRGRVLEATEPVQVEVAPINREFTITMRSFLFSVHKSADTRRKKMRDQLEKHPGVCYLYRKASTDIDIDLIYNPAPGTAPIQKALVSVLLDGKPIPKFEPKWIPLIASKPMEFVRKLPLESEEIKEGKEGSTLRVEVKNEAGKPLMIPYDLKVHVIDPSDYYITSWGVPKNYPGVGKQFSLTIRRRATDPTSRDMQVVVEIVAPPVPQLTVVHSNAMVNERNKEKSDAPWFLLQDESIECSFFLEAELAEGLNVPDGLKYSVSVGGYSLQKLTPLIPSPAAATPAPPAAPVP